MRSRGRQVRLGEGQWGVCLKMGLEELLNEVREKASAQEKALLSEAQGTASELLEQARGEATKVIAAGRAEGEALAVEESRKVSSAELRAKRILAEAREKIIAHAIDRLRAKLGALASAKAGEKKALYERLCSSLAKKAVAEIGGTAVLYCRKQDRPLASRHAPVRSEINCLGGVIAEDAAGRVRVDYTFERLLEERADELARIAYGHFFGGRIAPAGGQKKARKVSKGRTVAKKKSIRQKTLPAKKAVKKKRK